MYTKQEASEIRQLFWTTLGQYMSPVPSSFDEKVNWINYKTGVREIRLRMDALNKEAFVAIEIRGTDEKRYQLYHLLLTLKDDFPPDYEWIEFCEDDQGKILSRIYIELEGYSVYKKEDWPQLISFFKTQVIFFDGFWAKYKEVFEMVSRYK